MIISTEFELNLIRIGQPLEALESWKSEKNYILGAVLKKFPRVNFNLKGRNFQRCDWSTLPGSSGDTLRRFSHLKYFLHGPEFLRCTVLQLQFPLPPP